MVLIAPEPACFFSKERQQPCYQNGSCQLRRLKLVSPWLVLVQQARVGQFSHGVHVFSQGLG